jgi:NitT/TauT family transport system substrate-binding protein
VPVDRVITNQFTDEINSYDRAGIISEAKKEDLSKID